MKSKSYTPLTLPQIATALGLSRKACAPLRKAMDSLIADGTAAKVKGDRYGLSGDLNLLAGTIAFRQRGGAFLDVSGSDERIEILNGPEVYCGHMPEIWLQQLKEKISLQM